MTDTNKIDLSLPTSQNIIAVSLSTFFDQNELESIKLSSLKCPVNQTATNPCGCMEYFIEFENGKSFSIHCIINAEVIPSTHYTLIKIKSGDLYQMEFKCNPREHNAEYLSLIIKRSINYEKYKSFEDKFYNKQNILRNFSNKMINDIGNDIDIYRQVKAKLVQIENMFDYSDDYILNNEFSKYQIKNIEFEIVIINNYIFKFIYKNTDNNKTDYCYFLRKRIGLDTLILIMDRCVNRIRINSLEDITF